MTLDTTNESVDYSCYTQFRPAPEGSGLNQDHLNDPLRRIMRLQTRWLLFYCAAMGIHMNWGESRSRRLATRQQNADQQPDKRAGADGFPWLVVHIVVGGRKRASSVLGGLVPHRHHRVFRLG